MLTRPLLMRFRPIFLSCLRTEINSIVKKVGIHSRIPMIEYITRPDTPKHLWRSCFCGELSREHIGMKVYLCGWLHYSRLSGRFLILRDGYGMVQVYSETPLSSSVPLESVLRVVGTVRTRPDKDINKSMSTGSIEVLAESIEVINPLSTNLSFKPKDRTTTNENERLKYRYIDMRNEYLQRNLRFRSALILRMRNFLCEKLGFVDVETPYLFKKTPGGAREFIVPTHFHGKFYCLPQSPQQFKQLLMVGGIDRYMQIARCFRDEASRSDRQPEFTQLDLELSFTTDEEIYCIIENLLNDFWPLVQNVRDDISTLTIPFPRLTYNQAMTRFGSDKPDIRFDLEISEPDHNGMVGFSVPNSQVSVLSKHDWTQLQYIIQSATGNDINFDQAKNIPYELRNVVNCDLNDTVVFVRDHSEEKLKVLGLARTELAKLLNTKGAYNRFRGFYRSSGVPIYKPGLHFLWINNFPLFERGESGEWTSVHHPFTAPTTETTEFLYSDPSRVIGQHYDLVCNGQEIGGGSIRIHNSGIQEYVLSSILKEPALEMQYFLDALKSGAPPHGGIALGLDRFLAIILNAPSIRDVIAFPKAADGKDLLCGSPTKPSPSDLEFYGLMPLKNE